MSRKNRGKLKKWSFQKQSTKPVTLATYPWDAGATGQANRAGLVEEEATDVTAEGETPNPNKVKRFRRVDMLEVWHGRYIREKRNPHTGELSPYLTTRQFNAAVSLRNAFEATGRAPGWPDNDRVQSSPKPDHAVTIQIDRLSRYHRIAKMVIANDRAILDWCVLQGRSPKGTGITFDRGHLALRAALDRLADRLERSTGSVSV